MFEEYEPVPKHVIRNDKAEKFLSKDYYKIFHIFTSDILYKSNYGIRSNSFVLESVWERNKRINPGNPPWFSRKRINPGNSPWFSRICPSPAVLPLNSCKGFVRTNIKELNKFYPECSYEDFDYIKVSREEVIAAYGLDIIKEKII